MRLLITGGAGYIGSHVVLSALEKGFKVTVLDNLSTGLEENINQNVKFIFGSTNIKSDLDKVFKDDPYDSIIHLAASKAAGESMINPYAYLENNIIGSLNIIKACLKNNVKSLIFSSSAAVYGSPQKIPIDEQHPLNPENYYGYTKTVIEDNLKWFSDLTDFCYASLRYFNAAGYDINKRILGTEVNPQNLIPRIMETATGIRSFINIYGNDYPTKDGTGVRDYIHVNDLADAHLKAVEYTIKKKKNLVVNLGSGRGYSVLEIIAKIEEVVQLKIKCKFQDRRSGDPSIVVADPSLAKRLINWESRYSDLNTIIKSNVHIYRNRG